MSEIVKNDKEFITSETSKITSDVSKASGNSMSAISFGSTTKCPSSEPGVVSVFIACCKEMFDRIKSDMADINKIGDGFKTMDNVMKGQATKLNITVKSSAIGEIAVEKFDDKSKSLSDYNSVKKQLEKVAEENGIEIEEEEDTESYSGYVSNTDPGQGHYGNDNNMANFGNIEPSNLDNPVEEYYDETPNGNASYINNPEVKPEVESEVTRLNMPEEEIIEPEEVVVPEVEPVVYDDVVPEEIETSAASAVKKTSPLGAAAIAAGIGMAGAAVYGANKYIKEKEEEEEDMAGDEV